ncbi:MAG TPA: DUF2680 domain-containing protein [Bacillus bacterium]|nr:DUF2680 domain-containing protein [Bacillus sp. (in: firmicutes)]
MKKFMFLLSVLFLTLGLAIPAWAENEVADNPEPKVELTKAQKRELAKIHQEIFEKKLKLIDKHVEFGVMTKEQGDKIKAKLQEKAKMMKEKGYMPRHCHKDKDDD